MRNDRFTGQGAAATLSCLLAAAGLCLLSGCGAATQTEAAPPGQAAPAPAAASVSAEAPETDGFTVVDDWPDLLNRVETVPEDGRPGHICGTCLVLVVASPGDKIAALGVRAKVDPSKVKFPVTGAKLKITATNGQKQTIKLDPKQIAVGKTVLLKNGNPKLKFAGAKTLVGAKVELEVKGKAPGQRHMMRLPIGVK